MDPSHHDDLLLACSANGGTEVFVPSVDFSVPLDERRIGMHLDDLLRKGSVSSCEQGIKVSVKDCKNRQHRDGWYREPVSALVVNTVGRLNTFPRAAWARMLLRYSSG